MGQEKKDKLEEAAERAGEVVGEVLKEVLNVVKAFGRGLAKSLREDKGQGRSEASALSRLPEPQKQVREEH